MMSDFADVPRVPSKIVYKMFEGLNFRSAKRNETFKGIKVFSSLFAASRLLFFVAFSVCAMLLFFFSMWVWVKPYIIAFTWRKNVLAPVYLGTRAMAGARLAFFLC